MRVAKLCIYHWFNMKPLKDENEVVSKVKSTTKYAFVAPGAIGKGRGRGLRSMWSIGVSKTDNPFSQSSETVGIVAKGRGRCLRSMTNAQDVRASSKNPLDLPKGNVPSFSSTNEVMKYIQENSPSAQGNIQGLTSMRSFEDFENENRFFNQNARDAYQGLSRPLKSFRSTMQPISQGLETMKETFLIRKKEHMQTDVRNFLSPGDVTKSTQTFETSVFQELQTTKNPPLVDEKEKMQTDIPNVASTDQVKQSSRTVETSSCATEKDKKVRGSNKCKQVASLEVGQKLKVTFYNNRTVGNNSNLFSRHLGKIVRDRNICPLGVSSWRHIKEEKLNHMWAAVKDKFESDDMDIYRDNVLTWMKELWNKWRGQLHTNYVKGKTTQEALKNMPNGVDKKQWEWLVKEHFSLKKFQARSNRNAINRSKLNMLHHIGSKPIREIIYQKGGKDGKPPNLGTIFFGTRKKNNILLDSETIEKHAQIQELVQSEPSLPTIEIVEKCFGPQSRSHVFGFGGGVKAKDLKGGTSSKAELLAELCSTRTENESLKDRMSTFENEIKELKQFKEFILAQYTNVQPLVHDQENDNSENGYSDP